MAEHAISIRVSDEVWKLLEREARRAGVSSEELVRDAAVMRVAHLTSAPQGAPPPAVTDPARLESLRATRLLGAPPDEAFDRLARLAARLLDTPIALITLVDAHRQFLMSCPGVSSPLDEERETPLSHSICQHVVERRKPLVVGDLREHPVLRDSLAITDLQVIAYAGVPIMRPDGHIMGSLCVTDVKPRHWTPDQVRILEDLAGSVASEIELRAR